MKKALVLGGGDDQRALIEELRKRNYSISLIDYYSDPPSIDLVDAHYRVSTLDTQEVLKVAASNNVNLVTTACIDQALLTVSYVCERLGLHSLLSYEKALRVTNKSYMKKILYQNKIPTSNYTILESPHEPVKIEHLKFPLVIKPADGNGSYGIQKVIDLNELQTAVTKAFEVSRSKIVVIEEYISGEELSIDVFVINSVAEIILITKSIKIPNKNKVFPILQSLYPAEIKQSVLIKIKRVIQKIVDVFQINNTPLLVQLLMKDDELFTIEFGVRIAGGSKHHLIKHITGFDIMKAYVDTLFGSINKISLTPINKYVSMNYIYADSGTFAYIKNVTDLISSGLTVALFQYKKKGAIFTGSSASRDRAGSFLVEANSINEMQEKIDKIDNTIQVVSDNEADLMIHGIYNMTGR